MTRPEHLPDFSDPPLDEVVLGVQFTPVPGYLAVHSKDLWELFRGEFPSVEEQPVLDTHFETFGGPNSDQGPKFHFGQPPVGSRLWFISEDGNHILQFQPDRMITNWRRQNSQGTYPRFEGIADSFSKNLTKLFSHLEKSFGHSTDVNQAEVAYINIIPVEDFSHPSKWFSFWNDTHFEVEGINTSFSEVIRDEHDRPFARLKYEIQSVFTPDGKRRAFRFSLTYKGKPAGRDISSVDDFIAGGREKIVTRFEELTSQSAHEIWGIK
ncbi:TIGR04255 family protein [Sulfitobacter sp. D7]|uniref:TIGR04255 family protein n=1 Tax=Sulfitobacter sp. D7 TaxID=1968541 RepID=UPI000E77F22B|nr:TIGR04255 family protein [Sulfitobacter sp. D7]AYE84850.1 hypothetical protein B5M07_01240 [Sulfitobacter sp. D7]